MLLLFENQSTDPVFIPGFLLLFLFEITILSVSVQMRSKSTFYRQADKENY